MEKTDLDSRIKARGKDFFASISGEAPSIFNKSWWTGKVMDWAMRNEQFKVQLFRFVDVLPYLSTGESLGRHIEEYFAAQDQDIPAVLKWGAKGAGLGGEDLSLGIRLDRLQLDVGRVLEAQVDDHDVGGPVLAAELAGH